MVMYIITSKLNSTFGTIGKATGVKMTAKAVGKNSNFCVRVKKNLNKWQNFKQFFLLNRLLRLSVNENLLLLSFLVHFFHLAPRIWEL